MISENEYKMLRDRFVQNEMLLRGKQQQINSLLEITKAVNSNFNEAALFKIYEYVLRSQLGLKELAVFYKKEGWECVINLSNNEVVKKIDVEQDLKKFTKIQKIGDDKLLKDIFYEIVPILQKQDPIAYVLVGALENIQSQSIEESVKFIQTITNIILVAVENKRLFKRQVEQEVIKKELEFAGRMQNMLIPKDFPSNDLFEISGVYLPHQDLGGDYYDFFQISETKYVVCIGDISGKGIPAGLVMSNFQANVKTLLPLFPELDKVIPILNKKVNELTSGEKYITFFIGVYDTITRELQYVNAGHNPILRITKTHTEELMEGATILGMFTPLPFLTVGKTTIPENTLLFLYTDGLTDMKDDAGEYFEFGSLIEFIQKNHALSPEEINKSILNKIQSQRATGTFVDDISILCCRFK